MAMSPQELKALLATMDAVLALGEVARIQGRVDQVNDLMDKWDELKRLRAMNKE